MTHFYITYFDQRYAARGRVMLRSLRRHDPDATIAALCFDDITLALVAGMDDAQIQPIAHRAILEFEPRLRDCARRPRNAFYATHKPVLPLYVFDRWPEAARVTHIDADTWFFSSPAPIFAEAPDAAMLVSPHRYPDANARWANFYGAFNAGFISWRRSEAAMQCLHEYREQCLTRVERDTTPGNFMNQGYLTAWPERYAAVHSIDHPGANLAPWNARTLPLINRYEDGRNRVLVGGRELIFYHFSDMFRDADGFWRTSYLEFGEANLAVALLKIYLPYFKEVDAEFATLAAAGIRLLRMEAPERREVCWLLPWLLPWLPRLPSCRNGSRVIRRALTPAQGGRRTGRRSVYRHRRRAGRDGAI